MKNHRLFVAILIVQSIANIVLAIFIWSLITNPNSDFNRNIQSAIQSYSESFKPISIKGEDGEQGIQGEKGDPGVGQKGDKGDQGDTGDEGNTIQGPQGEKGDKGDQGEQGAPGERAVWECQNNRWVYKYPSDEDWSITDGACIAL